MLFLLEIGVVSGVVFVFSGFMLVLCFVSVMSVDDDDRCYIKMMYHFF